jgi:hypothetical protein
VNNYRVQLYENHRLVPKIDDDGNIIGSLLLFNHKFSYDGIWKIKNNLLSTD